MHDRPGPLEVDPGDRAGPVEPDRHRVGGEGRVLGGQEDLGAVGRRSSPVRGSSGPEPLSRMIATISASVPIPSRIASPSSPRASASVVAEAEGGLVAAEPEQGPVEPEGRGVGLAGPLVAVELAGEEGRFGLRVGDRGEAGGVGEVGVLAELAGPALADGPAQFLVVVGEVEERRCRRPTPGP